MPPLPLRLPEIILLLVDDALTLMIIDISHHKMLSIFGYMDTIAVAKAALQS